MPAGVTAEEYHKWLMTGASATDVREFAVAADSGDTALLNIVLTLAFWLIVVGILNVLFLGYGLFKKPRTGEEANPSTSSE